MLFVVLALVIATLESYTWLFRPSAFASISPITIGLPLVIAVGALRRSASERMAILTFVAMLGVSLNRAAITPPVLVHAVVLAGAVFLAWQGYGIASPRKRPLNRLAVAALVTLAGFLLPWAWSLI